MAIPQLAEDAFEPLERRPPNPEIAILAGWRAELTDFYRLMKSFKGADPSEIFMDLAAFSARASEIRFRIMDNESRRYGTFRTRQLDPFLDECDRQFRVWSRVQSVRAMEADLTRGL